MNQQTFTYSPPIKTSSKHPPTFVSEAVGFSTSSRTAATAAKRMALALAVVSGAANAVAAPAYSFDVSQFDNEADEAISIRAADLREIAEDEGMSFSETSLGYLRRFVAAHGYDFKSPSIFLTDRGTLRAVWRTDQQEQVALDFRDNGLVHFVIFSTDLGGMMNRATGETSFGNAMRQVKASEAAHILQA